jgi:hypothetical protein
MTLEFLSRAFEAASLAYNFGFAAFVDDVVQHSFDALIQFAIAAAVNAGNSLSKAFTSVLECMSELVFFVAVILVAGNRNFFDFTFLKFA